jgi:hypothetical protein
MSDKFDKLIEQTFRSLISEQSPEDETQLGSDPIQQAKGRAEEIGKKAEPTPKEQQLAKLQQDAEGKQVKQTEDDIEDLKSANKELDAKAKQ